MEMHEATKQDVLDVIGEERPMLREFAEWCVEGEIYTAEEAMHLLTMDWDGRAYPEDILGEDVLVDIRRFLCNLAEFALEKARKEQGYDETRTGYIFPSVYPFYDDSSDIVVYHMSTRTLLARTCWKTWSTDPDLLETELEHLVEEIKKGIDLVRKRAKEGEGV